MDRLRIFFKPTDIYTSQRLMLSLLLSVGLFPLRITESRNHKRLAISIVGYVLSVLFIIFFIACFIILLMYNDILKKARKTFIARLASAVKFFNLIGLMWLIYGSCMCCSKRIRTCMQKIVNIDAKLNLIGVEINYWKGFHFSIFLISFIIMHWTLSLVMSIITNNFFLEQKQEIQDIPTLTFELWTTFFTQHVTLVTISVVNCYFASIAYEINKRFEAMNRMLKCLCGPEYASNIDSIESVEWNIRNKFQINDLVHDLCIIQGDLCDVCEIASDFFSVKMMFIIGTAFLCLLANGYFATLILLSDENGLDMQEISDMLFFIVENIMVATGIVIACNSSYRIGEQVWYLVFIS